MAFGALFASFGTMVEIRRETPKTYRSKKNMKKVLLILVIFVSLNSAQAVSNNYFVEKGIPNIIRGLDSNIDGLIESCIYQSVLLKNKYPGLYYGGILSKLKYLSSNGSSIKIRYQAHLAYLYIKNTDQFGEIDLNINSDPEDNFKILINQIERLARK